MATLKGLIYQRGNAWNGYRMPLGSPTELAATQWSDRSILMPNASQLLPSGSYGFAIKGIIQ
jgi:hypothetical protein